MHGFLSKQTAGGGSEYKRNGQVGLTYRPTIVTTSILSKKSTLSTPSSGEVDFFCVRHVRHVASTTVDNIAVDSKSASVDIWIKSTVTLG